MCDGEILEILLGEACWTSFRIFVSIFPRLKSLKTRKPKQKNVNNFCVRRENRLISFEEETAKASMAHNSKNGIYKRNSPMSEFVVVENERKKKEF